MKKQTLFLAVLFITAAITLIGCNKKEETTPSDKLVVYGIISDGTNGTPLGDVKIACYDGNPADLDPESPNYNSNDIVKMVTSAVTGSDGTYEFTINRPDVRIKYVVMTEKVGYMPYGDYLSIDNADSNGRMRFDIQLYLQSN